MGLLYNSTRYAETALRPEWGEERYKITKLRSYPNELPYYL